MKYFGTVTITLHGWFDADGEERKIKYYVFKLKNPDGKLI